MIAHSVIRPLCVLLAVAIGAPPGWAQAPPQAAKPAPEEVVTFPLKIAILEGNNVVNSIQLGRSVTPIVEVRDQNEFPVEGASVVFTLPETGPGGIFPGKRSSLTVRADLQGQASAPFLVNGLAGRFRIHVVAIAGNRKGDAWIEQTNSVGDYIGRAMPARRWYQKWYVWAIAGAAAGGLAVALKRGGSSSPPTLTITPGGPVFGVPH